MFWAQSLLAGNGAGVTCLRESRTPITTLNVATYVTPFNEFLAMDYASDRGLVPSIGETFIGNRRNSVKSDLL